MWADHNGKQYKSKEEMCAAYHISVSAYNGRIKRGWTKEEALTKGTDLRAVTDHLGNRYASETAMCRAYGITLGAYQNRRKRGWTKAEALTTTLKEKGRKECTDHLGNVYQTEADMCRAYGIKNSTYTSRRKLGWTQEAALTAEKENWHCTDHKGNRFANEQAMCRKYRITQNVYRARLRLGWTQEKALTGKKQSYCCTDHLGNRYESESEMCRAYGLSVQAYRGRRKLGWTQEAALTRKTEAMPNECTDHLGNVFQSVSEMCRHYRIPVNTYNNRLKLGWTVKDALTKETNRRPVCAGDCVMQACGLPATVLSDSEHYFLTVEFADGTVVKVKQHVFRAGEAVHPDLRRTGKVNTFAGFKAKFLIQNGDRVLYACECTRCGMRSIMTPQEMLQHKKIHVN